MPTKRSRLTRALRPAPQTPRVADLLFEIGTEELPAAYLPSLIDQLARESTALVHSHHLTAAGVESYGTPRRLALIIRGLDATQRQPAEEIRGPAKQACYDPQGKPTPALLGFLRSRGGSLADVKIISSDKGDYAYLVKRPVAGPTTKILPALLAELITRLRAPKTMRWDATGVRFARPIRWLVALYGTTPIRCTFGRLVSEPRTWVGLPKRPRAAAVRSLQTYLRTLKTARIILDHPQRRAVIEQAVRRLATRHRGEPVTEMLTHGLLDEVTHLVEEPVPMAGTFDPSYLALPREVLLASMAKHQRVFAVESNGRLVPACVAILEGTPTRPATVRAVIERILNARLADSLLFWNEDHRRLPLHQMAEQLAGVTFHARLGSMDDKTVRLRALAEPIAEAWGLADEERQQVRRACQLAKADLVSAMVREFPTLQGVIGKYYARDSHEPEPVAEALEEQYLPAGARLPTTVIGAALAIIDKFDTLASYFSVGIEPTGDQDPFGLRRAAQGIVEVAWQMHRSLPVERLLLTHKSSAHRQPSPTASAGRTAPDDLTVAAKHLKKYLFERLYTFAWPTPAPSQDCIDAVLASPCNDLVDTMDRIVNLQRLSGQTELLKAAKVIERTRNILKGAPIRQLDVDPARLQEPLERHLWEVYTAHRDRVLQLTEQKAYAEATTTYGEAFYTPLHEFFDRVLVNVPDEPVRQNRLALMRAINTLYTDRIADLSKLTLVQHEESA